jgi:hypothetical protein
MGADVDGLACFLHHPTICGCHTMGQSFMTSVAPSHRATMGGGAFLGDAKHPGLDI